jgi:hypothetical protein
LAAGQLALALVLAGAGLMIKTTIRTFQFNAGYDASRVLMMLNFELQNYFSIQTSAFRNYSATL